MTANQVETMIKQHFTIKDGTTRDDINSLCMILSCGYKKKDEFKDIEEFIINSKSGGSSRPQTVAMVQFRFAKSQRRAYEIVKKSGVYE